jgi:hypothetical protein
MILLQERQPPIIERFDKNLQICGEAVMQPQAPRKSQQHSLHCCSKWARLTFSTMSMLAMLGQPPEKRAEKT